MAEGLLLVDKPGGVTSFDVVAQVRRACHERQVGHAGTLDPMATGLLVLLVGAATRLARWTVGLDKVYDARVRFGSATDTYDAAGQVTHESAMDVDAAALEAALHPFLGAIRQRPPVFSAIKRGGRPLHRIARRTRAEGGDLAAIEVAERTVVIHALEVLAFVAPDLTLRVHCGSGTYVRSLAHDLGRALGGHAHLAALRRTRVGPFSLADAVPLDRLGPAPALHPAERAVAHLPAVAIDDEAERRLRLGQQAVLADLVERAAGAGAVRLLREDGRLVAIAERPPQGGLVLVRVVPAQPDRTLAG